MAHVIGERKPQNLVVLTHAVSTSGKYWIFYGHHYVEGHLCYDVGYRNNDNQGIVRRHYLGRSEEERKAQEASALAYWNEFRNKMTEKPDYVEEHQNEQGLTEIDPRSFFSTPSRQVD